MDKRKWRALIKLCSILLMVAVSQMGCAIGYYGKADFRTFQINVPTGLVGKDKSAIINALGVPDSTANAGETEYWRYKNKSGFFAVLYGKTQEKDLVLEFKEDKVTSNYLMDKGSSISILTVQGPIAN